MKKAIKIILGLVIVAAILGGIFYGVFKYASQYETENTGNSGLKYTLSDDGTYYICSGIGSCDDKKITIADSYDNIPVTEIAEEAFFDCGTITSVTIPDSITVMGEGAFEYCSNLKSVTIGSGITIIDDYTFYECTSLESVVIGENVIEIGQAAFYYCLALKDITFGSNLKIIGETAFGDCGSLEQITIPASVKILNGAILGWCDSLASVTFENTSGWYVTQTENAESGVNLSSADLADASMAAKYLTNSDFYRNYYWYNTNT